MGKKPYDNFNERWYNESNDNYWDLQNQTTNNELDSSMLTADQKPSPNYDYKYRLV